MPGTGQPGGEPWSRGPHGGSGRITILIVDPHGPMREALATLLAAEPDFHVIASVPGLEEALGIVRRRRPWVTLVDLAAVGEPVADGFAALRDTRPATVILVIGVVDDPVTEREVVRAGAMARILKDTPPHELIRTVRAAASGRARLRIVPRDP